MDKFIGAPLKYKELEQISEDSTLKKGEYYIFKKDDEIISLRTQEQLENATNPQKVKENLLAKLTENTGETPRIVYVKVSWGEIKEWTHPYYGKGYYVMDYRVEFHMQDVGVITASVILAIAVLTIIVGITLVGAWLIWHAVNIMPAPFDWGFIILVLAGIFILVFVILGGKGKVTKRGVTVG